jgi:hypothetical protein
MGLDVPLAAPALYAAYQYATITSKRDYVNENYSGLTGTGSVVSLNNNKEATFILNAATHGAVMWNQSGGNKEVFDKNVDALISSLTTSGHASNLLLASNTADMIKAFKVNFYRGAEVARDTASGNPADIKKNILYKAKQGNYFVTSDNKNANSDPFGGLSKVQPIGVKEAQQQQKQKVKAPKLR